MKLDIKKLQSIPKTARFLADSVLAKLREGKKVLLFLTGGSSVPVGIAFSKMLKNSPHSNLTITLTDERYGEMRHTDSNCGKLTREGFDLPEAKIIPVLSGIDMEATTQKFNNTLKNELQSADYKIGLFGIGADGHTAGILPGSVAVSSEKMVEGYHTEEFDRITMTIKAISMLDEAVVFLKDATKKEALEKLQLEVSVFEQPAQALKKVPKLTIFTNFE